MIPVLVCDTSSFPRSRAGEADYSLPVSSYDVIYRIVSNKSLEVPTFASL
jgi:hypothetical protein